MASALLAILDRVSDGFLRPLILAMTLVLATAAAAVADPWTLIGWNNLGMHCMDPDYGVLALLPPYNTLEAQLVDANGQLVRVPAW